jgi:hypothetical protein
VPRRTRPAPRSGSSATPSTRPREAFMKRYLLYVRHVSVCRTLQAQTATAPQGVQTSSPYLGVTWHSPAYGEAHLDHLRIPAPLRPALPLIKVAAVGALVASSNLARARRVVGPGMVTYYASAATFHIAAGDSAVKDRSCCCVRIAGCEHRLIGRARSAGRSVPGVAADAAVVLVQKSGPIDVGPAEGIDIESGAIS